VLFRSGGAGPGAGPAPASDPCGRGGGSGTAGPCGAGPENRHGDAGPRTLSASSSRRDLQGSGSALTREEAEAVLAQAGEGPDEAFPLLDCAIDRKSTRLNSSHVKISYAVFCLKKKKYNNNT